MISIKRSHKVCFFMVFFLWWFCPYFGTAKEGSVESRSDNTLYGQNFTFSWFQRTVLLWNLPYEILFLLSLLFSLSHEILLFRNLYNRPFFFLLKLKWNCSLFVVFVRCSLLPEFVPKKFCCELSFTELFLIKYPFLAT